MKKLKKSDGSLNIVEDIQPVVQDIGSVVQLGISGTNDSAVAGAQISTTVITPDIYALFPTAVTRTKIGRDLTQEEIDTIIEFGQEIVPNSGNTTSKNNYVLDDSRLADIRQFCELSIAAYMNNIIKSKPGNSAYITQSWINFTKPGQFHHQHTHPNSYISGVFYINADPEHDKIHFSKNQHIAMKVAPAEWNTYNSDSWWLPSGTGDLLIFPSSLTHQVNNTQGPNDRISLSFNTFIRGTLGSAEELTELKNY